MVIMCCRYFHLILIKGIYLKWKFIIGEGRERYGGVGCGRARVGIGQKVGKKVVEGVVEGIIEGIGEG